jgi:hypothetical protein
MKPILLVSALALSTIASVALAESITPADHQARPVQLTSAQIDKVVAGAIKEVILSVANPAGKLPKGQQGEEPNNTKFVVESENQNPSGKAPSGQNKPE